MWHQSNKQTSESSNRDTLARCAASTRKELEKALIKAESRDRPKGKK